MDSVYLYLFILVSILVWILFAERIKRIARPILNLLFEQTPDNNSASSHNTDQPRLRVVSCEEEPDEDEIKSIYREIASQLKPFDRVLVRDEDHEEWEIEYYGHFNDDDRDPFPFVCLSSAYAQCILYEGNEHLLGTNEKAAITSNNYANSNY